MKTVLVQILDADNIALTSDTHKATLKKQGPSSWHMRVTLKVANTGFLLTANFNCFETALGTTIVMMTS